MMNKNEASGAFREKNDKGRNVTMRISFMRHGRKDKSENLSLEGHQEAVNKGEEKEPLKDGVKHYSSTLRRNVETVEAMIEGMNQAGNADKVFKPRARLELAPPDWPDDIKQDIKDRVKLGQEAVYDYFMHDPKVQPYFKEWSGGMASTVDLFSRMSERLYSNSEVKLEHVTHDGNIAKFLCEIARFDDGNGNQIHLDDLSSVGGSIQPLEGFEFLVKTDDQGARSTQLFFRGKELAIDQDRMANLVEMNKEAPYRGRAA